MQPLGQISAGLASKRAEKRQTERRPPSASTCTLFHASSGRRVQFRETGAELERVLLPPASSFLQAARELRASHFLRSGLLIARRKWPKSKQQAWQGAQHERQHEQRALMPCGKKPLVARARRPSAQRAELDKYSDFAR